MAYRGWRIKGALATPRVPLNDEIYDVTDQELGPVTTQTNNQKIARLLCREIIANIAIHDQSAQKVSLAISGNATGVLKVEIIHDGNQVDQLAAASPCKVLKSICSKLNITYTFNNTAIDRTYTVSITL